MLITKLPAGSKYYVKKPIPVRVVQMKEPFTVETKEGKLDGKAGDYLIEGVFGELYPCDRVIFESTYRGFRISEKVAQESRRMLLMDKGTR